MPSNVDIEIMRGLWRQANRKAEGIEIPCKSESEARRVRFQLYNAVKEARKPGAMVDEELREAVANCSLGFKEGAPTVLQLRQKMRSEMLMKMAELAGDAVKPMAGEQESVGRVMARLEAEGLAPAGDPPAAVPGIDFPVAPARRQPFDYEALVRKAQTAVGKKPGDAE